MYNLYNIEQKYKKYLLSVNKKPNTIRNYLSDFGYFLSWLLQDNREIDVQSFDEAEIGHYISEEVIHRYVLFLHASMPPKTVKRRESSLNSIVTFFGKKLPIKSKNLHQITKSDMRERLISRNIFSKNLVFLVSTLILLLGALVYSFSTQFSPLKPAVATTYIKLENSTSSTPSSGNFELSMKNAQNLLVFEGICSVRNNSSFAIAYLDDCSVSTKRVNFLPGDSFNVTLINKHMFQHKVYYLHGLICDKLDGIEHCNIEQNLSPTPTLIKTDVGRIGALEKSESLVKTTYQSLDIFDKYEVVDVSRGFLVKPTSVTGIGLVIDKAEAQGTYFNYVVALAGNIELPASFVDNIQSAQLGSPITLASGKLVVNNNPSNFVFGSVVALDNSCKNGTTYCGNVTLRIEPHWTVPIF